jgi:hypothetical protein
VSRMDALQETKRGVGILCRCGKPARITARGLTLCYECFDAQMEFLDAPAEPARKRVLKRIRYVDHMANTNVLLGQQLLHLG